MSAGHLSLGAVVGASIAWAAQATGQHVTTGAALGWVGTVMAFSVGPDLDTGGSLVSRTLFPLRILWVLAHRLLELAIGNERADYWMKHRGITHDAICSTPVVLLAGLGLCWWFGWPAWCAAAAAVGWVAHILGDWPTLSGVPLGMPWTEKCHALRLFRVGSPVELLIVMPGLWLAAGFLGWHVLLAGAPVPS
jgi:membrane-bound metal-dependent hydrolase YbcI (DUF457 family)